mmetsp:Transcript_20142/g.61117  ORF Transcript_20142/g.61117 Transcript_20142/m.61117 type:complete len:249 (-) Transcript_20142:2043-2789(-)
MARNEEKAGNMLNKWITMKEEYERGPNLKRKKRPYLASECDSLKEAEYWRRQVIKDIAKGVGEIQNAALGEHVIRELNDKINKLIREKRHWNKRITALGGPDYNRSEPRVYEGDGQALPEGWGATGESGRSRYFYFGAAKTLPGVRELFEAAPTKGKPKRTRAELYKTITPDYYGYRKPDPDHSPNTPTPQTQTLTLNPIPKGTRMTAPSWSLRRPPRPSSWTRLWKSGSATRSDPSLRRTTATRRRS